MKLPGAVVRELQSTLVAAFKRAPLQQMVRVYLDIDLDVIAQGGTLSDIVFALIDWAERNDRLNDLLSGACASRPENQKLLALAAEIKRMGQARPASVVTALEVIIEYVRQEATVMVEPQPPAEETTVDHTNLAEVLSRRSFVVTRALEAAVAQLALSDLIAIIIHDTWLARQSENPCFHFDGNAISSQDIARALKVKPRA